jgi:hypothetical protein
MLQVNITNAFNIAFCKLIFQELSVTCEQLFQLNILFIPFMPIVPFFL